MKRHLLFTLLAFLCFGSGLKAQTFQPDSLSGFNRFFIPSDTFSKPRAIGVGATIGGLYTGASLALYNIWYKDFPLTTFHGFNDNAEWLQMDKGGHVLNAYYETNWAFGLFRWSGMSKGKSIGYAALTSTAIQSTIEIFDGFSEEWGFSWGDLAANTIGTGLSAGQQAIWDEQRITIKFSFIPTDHPAELQYRADQLYGTSFSERLLKDYNGLTYWLSVNPHSFMKDESKFPKWLNIAAGYGAEGLYGGFENEWCADSDVKPEDCDPSYLITTDVPRQRQYFLSLDLDLTKIETNKPFLKTLFGVVNVIKIPAPALEYREGEGFKGHWIYF